MHVCRAARGFAEGAAYKNKSTKAFQGQFRRKIGVGLAEQKSDCLDPFHEPFGKAA